MAFTDYFTDANDRPLILYITHPRKSSMSPYSLVFRIMLACVFISTFACKRKHHDDAPAPQLSLAEDTLHDRQWWIEKTVRLLRAGKGVSTADELQKFTAMTDDEIIDQLLAEKTFSTVAFDFNLFYLGYKSDSLRFVSPHDYLTFFPAVFLLQHAVALEGARRITNGDEFFGMLDWNIPEPRLPMMPIFGADGSDAPNSVQIRKTKLGTARDKFNTFVAKYEHQDPIKQVEFCADLKTVTDLSKLLNDIGLPFTKILAVFDNRDVTEFRSNIQFSACGQEPAADMPANTFELLKKFQAVIIGVIDDASNYDWDHYIPTSMDKVLFMPPVTGDRASDPNRYKNTWSWLFQNFSSPLPNSSTNANRKRASYILKRFFCDDLTPINLQASSGHNPENRHASDPNCQSCHYKLDPMAGFFRYMGSDGTIVKADEYMIFSDGATKPMTEYLPQWQRTDGGRPWNIGYVRSATDETINDYSDNPKDPQFEDLLAIIKHAPETKVCLVRRAFEYFVGDHQAVDPTYIESLATTFAEKPRDPAANPFKNLIKTLVKSRTYQAKDPDPEACYDYPDGIDPTQRPPCRVAALLERNCANCHRGSGAAGGLDLMSWTDVQGVKTFSHKDANGQPQSPKLTFQSLLDRMTASDPNRRMPLLKHISTADRDTLYLWFNERLTNMEKMP